MQCSATIGFFGSLGDRIGRSIVVDVPPEGCTIAQLRTRFAGLHPAAAAELMRTATRACADDRIVGEDHLVRAGDKIEFLPPLSGG
jgi:molybdopterin converting factor small subunit